MVGRHRELLRESVDVVINLVDGVDEVGEGGTQAEGGGLSEWEASQEREMGGGEDEEERVEPVVTLQRWETWERELGERVEDFSAGTGRKVEGEWVIVLCCVRGFIIVNWFSGY